MSARSLNKVMLIGNLTRDPNMRYTPNNQTPVCSFGLATNRDWTDEGGAKQERTEFHNLVAWSKLAEICGNLLHKGDKIYADGRMQTRDWKAEDGSQRRMTEIVLENMILLRSSGSSSSRGAEDYVSEDISADSLAGEAAPEAIATPETDDDIPF
jgi:single-strand DNA-binding protein